MYICTCECIGIWAFVTSMIRRKSRIPIKIKTKLNKTKQSEKENFPPQNKHQKYEKTRTLFMIHIDISLICTKKDSRQIHCNRQLYRHTRTELFVSIVASLRGKPILSRLSLVVVRKRNTRNVYTAKQIREILFSKCEIILK